MKLAVLIVSLLSLCETESYSPNANKATRPMVEMQKAAAGAFAAFTIASSVLTMSPAANAVPAFPTQVLAEKVIREGVYGEYEIDLPEQKYDDARSTFKSAKETKTKKGKYTALLAILIVGSFIIPMAQYWWYVKDDDSSDKFFAQNVPDPEPPKKKGWF
ncbi:hypothetical protein FisN_31Hh061 [Fistulifera solaris]|uniref:Uncharacterized protein n=1 Tax=Fistulifera solaris TaxID=1519565 RepID=A0A1Z5JA30_FISSO|nr:hypothetical protein FisN_31Hh061 [Fistulifera solaris]|eukprot:GAX10853.1 hypothetical protein FisN_31Hh061 [Fistulifera solaris]